MNANFMISAKLATPGLLKTKVFLKRGYGVIIAFHDVSNKILPRELIYIVDVII